MCCYRAECDGCGHVLDDYGDYQGMDTPHAAAKYAVEQAGWGWEHALVDGENTIRLWCPPCVTTTPQ